MDDISALIRQQRARLGWLTMKGRGEAEITDTQNRLRYLLALRELRKVDPSRLTDGEREQLLAAAR